MSAPCLVTPLRAAGDPGRFGGKGAQLASALCAGLPVPDGWALSWEDVATLALPDSSGLEAALRAAVIGCGPVAVRSSAVGEDSQEASFAGAHRTVLGVAGGDGVLAAVREVHASAVEPAALAYRERLAVAGAIRMGVVVQRMVDADVAGVLFTRNPVTGADELVVEASWGLGEAVVSGLVTPDHVRVDRHGRVLEHRAGEKDLAIRLTSTGATLETTVPAHLVEAPCLGAAEVQALHRLVLACDAAYGDSGHDLEFAFAGGTVHLLQRRPITHG